MGGDGIVLEHWNFKCLAVSTGPTFEDKPEFLIAEIQYTTHRILVAIVYRRPGAALFDELFEALSAFIPLYKCLVITGDFNANVLALQSSETTNLNTEKVFERHLLGVVGQILELEIRCNSGLRGDTTFSSWTRPLVSSE